MHTQVLVTQLQFDGQMIPAQKWGKQEKVVKLELSAEEEVMLETARKIWSSILSGLNVEDTTDFFKSGAGSMDVTRWVWSVRMCIHGQWCFVTSKSFLCSFIYPLSLSLIFIMVVSLFLGSLPLPNQIGRAHV